METEWKIGQVLECPNHGGSFDCNSFCRICEGECEFTYDGTLPCKECYKWIDGDVWREELGMCLECSNKFFDNGD